MDPHDDGQQGQLGAPVGDAVAAVPPPPEAAAPPPPAPPPLLSATTPVDGALGPERTEPGDGLLSQTLPSQHSPPQRLQEPGGPPLQPASQPPASQPPASQPPAGELLSLHPQSAPPPPPPPQQQQQQQQQGQQLPPPDMPPAHSGGSQYAALGTPSLAAPAPIMQLPATSFGPEVVSQLVAGHRPEGETNSGGYDSPGSLSAPSGWDSAPPRDGVELESAPGALQGTGGRGLFITVDAPGAPGQGLPASCMLAALRRHGWRGPVRELCGATAPTRSAIQDGINWVCEDLSPGSGHLVYFSGPVAVQSEGTTLLCCDHRDAGGLPISEVVGALAFMITPGVRTLVVIDPQGEAGSELPPADMAQSHTVTPAGTEAAMLGAPPDIAADLAEVVVLTVAPGQAAAAREVDRALADAAAAGPARKSPMSTAIADFTEQCKARFAPTLAAFVEGGYQAEDFAAWSLQSLSDLQQQLAAASLPGLQAAPLRNLARRCFAPVAMDGDTPASWTKHPPAVSLRAFARALAARHGEPCRVETLAGLNALLDGPALPRLGQPSPGSTLQYSTLERSFTDRPWRQTASEDAAGTPSECEPGGPLAPLPPLPQACRQRGGPCASAAAVAAAHPRPSVVQESEWDESGGGYRSPPQSPAVPAPSVHRRSPSGQPVLQPQFEEVEIPSAFRSAATTPAVAAAASPYHAPPPAAPLASVYDSPPAAGLCQYGAAERLSEDAAVLGARPSSRGRRSRRRLPKELPDDASDTMDVVIHLSAAPPPAEPPALHAARSLVAAVDSLFPMRGAGLQGLGERLDAALALARPQPPQEDDLCCLSGFLAEGGDIGPPLLLDPAAARLRCLADRCCGGYCFRPAAGDGPVWVYFKRHGVLCSSGDEAAGWVSYVKRSSSSWQRPAP
eukprot:TRINITY_DN21966_c0_g5_i1.p1 TRINITY_DN21966_c0_g5~~TRINITY_DN21966_c0_g5_i1.p1  ORF type:complete len:930 (+),score=236.27 TRINITY_DN21966_c0_g5_i1:81-2792(+)